MKKRTSQTRNKPRRKSKKLNRSFSRWAQYIQNQFLESLRFVSGAFLALVVIIGLVVLIEPVTSSISQAIWPTISIQEIVTAVAFVGLLSSLIVVIIVILVIWTWRAQEERATRDRLKQKHANILSNVQKNVESLIKLEIQ